MFACIYFVEDASLSVVGANDKNLEKLGDFGPREEVRMKWGKKTYHGTIVKVEDDESVLTHFTTRAYNELIKHLEVKPTEPPESLFSFSVKKSISGEKRERKKTKKVKESEAQDEELSPKKKKKGQPPIKTTEAAERVRKETIPQDDRPSPKKKESNQPPATATEAAPETSEKVLISLMEPAPKKKAIPDSHSVVMSSMLQQLSQEQEHGPSDLFTPQLMASTLVNNGINLTETWNVCRESFRSMDDPTNEGQEASIESPMPVNRDFMDLLKLLAKPEIHIQAQHLLGYLEARGNVEPPVCQDRLYENNISYQHTDPYNDVQQATNSNQGPVNVPPVFHLTHFIRDTRVRVRAFIFGIPVDG